MYLQNMFKTSKNNYRYLNQVGTVVIIASNGKRGRCIEKKSGGLCMAFSSCSAGHGSYRQSLEREAMQASAAAESEEEEEVKVELEIERGAIISPVSQSVRLQRESCCTTTTVSSGRLNVLEYGSCVLSFFRSALASLA